MAVVDRSECCGGPNSLACRDQHSGRAQKGRTQKDKLKSESVKCRFSKCRFSQARKRHININVFLSGWSWDDPGFVPGFHRFCPWDEPGENLGQTQVFSLFYTVEARQTRDSLPESLHIAQGAGCHSESRFFLRVAHLQNEVGTKDFFRGTNFLTKNALRNF